MLDEPSHLEGIGVALVSVPRFERALERFGERLLERVFTPAEVAYARRKRHGSQSLAARFAAKCAGRSLLRTWRAGSPCLRDLEVARRPSGEPMLALNGPAGEAVASRRLRFALSLAHDAQFAVASLWAEREMADAPDVLR